MSRATVDNFDWLIEAGDMIAHMETLSAADDGALEWRNTEAGFAERFVEAHAARQLRWVQQWGQWHVWDGVAWRPDLTVKVYDMIRKFLRVEASATNSQLPKSDMKRLGAAGTVAAVERLARADRQVAAVVEQWDKDPWILNTPGGCVDLETGEVRDHEARLYQTKTTATAPGGECARWRRFLLEVADGDEPLAAFLQRLAGYCLTGSTREHALFFLYGTGANGKGVFLNTLRNILADYASVAPIEAFTDTGRDRHPTELAGLRGARLVIAQETEEGRRWSESRIKAITGGDPIAARYMRQDFFEYTPQFKLLIAGNHKPALQNVDEAMRRRLHLVPFLRTIPPEQRDKDLQEKLRAEWPGILAWAIDGCVAYLGQGLAPPERVKAATREYFSAQDTFSAWIEECCDKQPDACEKPTLLFKSWRGFAEAGGYPLGNQKALAGRLEAAGFVSGRGGRRGRFWKGLQLRPGQLGDAR